MDPHGIYTSPKVLFWLAILGAYGVLEGIGRGFRHIPPLVRDMRARMRQSVHDTDFYYSYRESGYIVMPGGKEFVYSRRDRVVALRRMDEIPLKYRWSGEGEITEEMYPDSFRIEYSPRVAGQHGTKRRIRFDSAIEKGQEAEYTALIKCKQIGRNPESFLSSRCPHRVDELLMRVVFPATLLPDQVVYIKRNADGVETHREAIKELDRLTGEFRKLIKYAEPHIEHVLEWYANERKQ